MNARPLPFFRRNFSRLGLLGAAALTLAAGLPSSAFAAGNSTGSQGLVDIGAPSIGNATDINAAPIIYLGNLITTGSQAGYFSGLSTQILGPVTFTISSPTGLSFGSATLGSFASTSIVETQNTPGTRSFYILGNFTAGTFNPSLTPNPAPASIVITFTQSPTGTGAISDSAALSIPPAPTPTPTPSPTPTPTPAPVPSIVVSKKAGTNTRFTATGSSLLLTGTAANVNQIRWNFLKGATTKVKVSGSKWSVKISPLKKGVNSVQISGWNLTTNKGSKVVTVIITRK